MKFVGIENYETLNKPVIRAKDLKAGEMGIYSADGAEWLLIRGGRCMIAVGPDGQIHEYELPQKSEWEIDRILKPGERVVLEA